MKLSTKDFILIIICIFFLTTPIFIKVHHPVLYLICIISFISWGIHRRVNASEYEMKFYQKWHIVRRRKPWLRMLYVALDGFIYVAFLFLTRYSVDGFPSAQLFKTPYKLRVYLLSLLIISLATGAIRYRIKEKEYHSITKQE